MARQTDPIMAELRAIREEYAARFNYDVDAMFKHIRARQEASGREYVRLPTRRPESAVQEQPNPDVAPKPSARGSGGPVSSASERGTD